MQTNIEILMVLGFAVPEGRGKWACCFEIRLATGADALLLAPLLYRGELHGRRFLDAEAAVVAARQAGEREARRCIGGGQRGETGTERYCIVLESAASMVGRRPGRLR